MKNWHVYGFISLLFAIIGLWVCFPAIIETMPWTGKRETPWEERGVFGDSYGVLTSLFSALAFFGVLITIYFQYFQLKLVRQQARFDADQQMQQTRLAAMSAALDYYNSERARFQDDGYKLRDSKAALSDTQAALKGLTISIDQNETKRSAILDEIEHLIQQTRRAG